LELSHLVLRYVRGLNPLRTRVLAEPALQRADRADLDTFFASVYLVAKPKVPVPHLTR
jgi:hypothetical protein